MSPKKHRGSSDSSKPGAGQSKRRTGSSSSTSRDRSKQPSAAARGGARRSSPTQERSEEGHSHAERLQKILAAAGLGSRRECEELITTGRVEVNRQPVTELGARADRRTDEIRVDGVAIKMPRHIYYLVNKPPGVVCTNRDPGGRMRVVDLIDSHDRLFTIGRLDRSSEGLILVTNDGELANRLSHPRFGVTKTYRVEVAGHPQPEELRPLREGIRLAEGVVKVDHVLVRKRFKRSTEIEVILTEGINREIRRMLAKTGHKVLRLTRIAVGPVRLGEVPTGAYRELTDRELAMLRGLINKPHRRGGPIPARDRSSSRPRRSASSSSQGAAASQGAASQGAASRGGESRRKPSQSGRSQGGSRPGKSGAASYGNKGKRRSEQTHGAVDSGPRTGAVIGGDESSSAGAGGGESRVRSAKAGGKRRFGPRPVRGDGRGGRAAGSAGRKTGTAEGMGQGAAGGKRKPKGKPKGQRRER